MSWCDDFLHIARWALMAEDLRHRYIYAREPTDLPETPGIARALETATVLALYQAALGKGYIAEETVDHERAYPGYDGQNPKRADLAFKDEGRGKNWAYLEVKHYGGPGGSHVKSDVAKLRSIEQRSQRWLFVYRVRRTDTHAKALDNLLQRRFSSGVELHATQTFPSVPENHDKEGVCDLCLARVN